MITERVMALGDWEIQLADETPPTLLTTISTPFATVVVTPTRLPLSGLTDSIVTASALYAGVVLRPGPQRTLGGCGLAWFLGDDAGGAGWTDTGFTFSSTSLSSAVTSILSGTAFTSGTVAAGTVTDWVSGGTTRRTALDVAARDLGYEWRITPARVVSVASVSTLYGSTPTGVITRREVGHEASVRQGITGAIASTWDWEQYGSKAIVWSLYGSGSSGGASSYRDPAGNLMTIVRGFEQSDAPSGSETDIAAWWLSQINRSVRTVEIASVDYAITGQVPCGGQVYLYDREQGLYDTANPVQFAGGIIWPVSARVAAVSWPVERGMGVYYRIHNGSTVKYYDLTDWVVFENPGVRFEISTGAQTLAPPSTAPPLQAFFGPWQPYAAEWRATTTNPVIGNGAIVARFRRLGTQVEINAVVTAGSTTTFGAGNYVLTMPPGCVARTVTGGTQEGNATMFVGGASYPGNVQLLSGGTDMYLIHATSPQANAGPANPGVWANGDRFVITATFEVE